MSLVPWQKKCSPDCNRRACQPRHHQPDSRAGLEGGVQCGDNTRRSSTEDADRISATNSEVESAMNHMRRRAVLRDPNFSEEAFNAFNSGEAYIRAAQGVLARATDQYLKDIRVRKT